MLAAAARALHGERDSSVAIAWARDAARQLTALPQAAVCLMPRHGSPQWTPADAGLDFAGVGDPRTSSLLRSGLDAGTPIVLEDVAAAERNVPVPTRLQLALPLASLLVVPVMARDGLAQAAIFVGSHVPTAIPAAAVEAVTALAAHLGVALDNAATLTRMAEVEARGKEVVHALQEAVRPPAPVVPFTELGVHYVAADPSAPTGGDLYDWVVLPDGKLHVVVVDVMGKGVEATKHALSVTHALRLFAFDGCPLGELVARTDALVTAQNPELVATLLIARYDPPTGDVELAGGGHPPALVASGTGEVREIAAPGIPIGWPGAASHDVVRFRLERSDTLIVYTDGLIEATKDILRGLEELSAAAAATASYPATSLARALVERQLADAARHDDSLALVLRRRSPSSLPSHALGPFAHQFSPQAAAVPIARHLLADWLRLVPVESDAIDSILLAVSELTSNAVRHATGAPGSVQLRAWTEADAVVVEVSDDGGAMTWADTPAGEIPDPEAEQGRGLFLVRELADSVTGRVEDGRSIVRLVKHAVVGTDVC